MTAVGAAPAAMPGGRVLWMRAGSVGAGSPMAWRGAGRSRQWQAPARWAWSLAWAVALVVTRVVTWDVAPVVAWAARLVSAPVAVRTAAGAWHERGYLRA